MSKHNRKNEHLLKIEEIDTKIQDSEYEKTCPNTSDEKIREYFANKNIIWMTQEINHDGYDYYGPQSDLYDLYFIEKIEEIEEIENKYALYHYHTENWYCKKDDYKTYFLYRKKIVDESEFNISVFKREVDEKEEVAVKKEMIKYIQTILF